MAEKSRSQQATIYVGGFDQQVTTESLENAFIPFGDIANIHLPKPDLPSSDAKHRGFAYVEFEDPEDAAEAIDNMDQSEMFGRVIKVMAAKPQKEQNKGRDGTISIWQQVGEVPEVSISIK